jgi:hypothetical protein
MNQDVLNFTLLLRWLHQLIEQLEDPRQPSNGTKFGLKDIVLGAFAVFYMQCPSFLEHQRQVRSYHGHDNQPVVRQPLRRSWRSFSLKPRLVIFLIAQKLSTHWCRSRNDNQASSCLTLMIIRLTFFLWLQRIGTDTPPLLKFIRSPIFP